MFDKLVFYNCFVHRGFPLWNKNFDFIVLWKNRKKTETFRSIVILTHKYQPTTKFVRSHNLYEDRNTMLFALCFWRFESFFSSRPERLSLLVESWRLYVILRNAWVSSSTREFCVGVCLGLSWITCCFLAMRFYHWPSHFLKYQQSYVM